METTNFVPFIEFLERKDRKDKEKIFHKMREEADKNEEIYKLVALELMRIANEQFESIPVDAEPSPDWYSTFSFQITLPKAVAESLKKAILTADNPLAMQQKINAAFSYYIINGIGFVSLGESL